VTGTIYYFTSILGNVKAGYEATHGVDPITKRELEDWEQTIMVAAILGGGFVKSGTRGAKGVKSVGGKSTKNIPNDFANRSLLDSHFVKHGGEFNGAYKNADEYLNGARSVINNGIKVEYNYKGEIRTGYVNFMGNNRSGKAEFEFVGTNNNGAITTYHTQSGKKSWKTINSNNIPVINPVD
jgi:hypothetical protein